MPFPPRPIDEPLHGVTDYTAGTTLLTALPRLVGIESTESARQIRTAGFTPATARSPHTGWASSS